MNRLIPLLAFAVVAAFLIILAVAVPSPDLIAVIGLTLALVAYDFFSATRRRD